MDVKAAALPLGIGLILLAVVMRARLRGARVLNLDAKKYGFAFDVDAFGLVVLIGAALSLVPLYLFIRDYDARIAKYEGEAKQLQAKYDENVRQFKVIDTKISELVNEFKDQELRFALVFPVNDAPDYSPNDKPQATAFVWRKGMATAQRYDLAVFEFGEGGILATFSKLRQGDEIRVEVSHRKRTWVSDAVTVPSFRLAMRPPRQGAQK